MADIKVSVLESIIDNISLFTNVEDMSIEYKENKWWLGVKLPSLIKYYVVDYDTYSIIKEYK